MLELNTSNVRLSTPFKLNGGAYLLSRNSQLHASLREQRLYLIESPSSPCPIGFAGYISFSADTIGPYNSIVLPSSFRYLEDGDVAILDCERKSFRTIYRRCSPNNSFLLTERCSHYCVMCSQPPRTEDDSYLAHDLLNCIPLIDKQTVEIGFTGGEPTLLGDMFFRLVEASKRHLPHTSLHVLSNGRRFAEPSFANRLASISHHDLMMGIPIYSDDAEIHNFTVQAPHALDETLNGIINLKAAGIKVEIRVVLHRYTIPTLVSLAEFITRNLLFVDHVAFMGLEAMGFAKSNWTDLWIDPQAYQNELSQAASICAGLGMHVSIYNLPLCWIDPKLVRFYRRSISDWKNEYEDECSNCAAVAQCGGFFSSNVKAGVSQGVHRLSMEQVRRLGC
jgi:His-Xaa-Ser system radical SAM maturase HxsC